MSGRPRGEIRQVLVQAVETLADQHGSCTWREAAAFAQVGFAVAKQTFKDMARAGELEPIGQKPVQGSCRPMKLYAPRRRRGGWVTAGPALGDVLAGWVRG